MIPKCSFVLYLINMGFFLSLSFFFDLSDGEKEHSPREVQIVRSQHIEADTTLLLTNFTY